MIGGWFVILAVVVGVFAAVGGGVVAASRWRTRRVRGWAIAVAAAGVLVAGVPAVGGWVEATERFRYTGWEDVLLWVLCGGPVVAGLGLGAWGIVGRKPRGRECPRCRYDMSATAGLVCPECGRAAKSERAMVRRRRRRWAVAAGVVLALLGGGVWVGAKVRDGTWPDHVPDSVLVLLMPYYDENSAAAYEFRYRLPELAGLNDDNGPTGPPTPWQRFLARRCAAAVRHGGPVELAVETIQLLGARAEPAIPTLMRLLDDAEAGTRLSAFNALGTIYAAEGAPDPAPFLAAALRGCADADEGVRVRALGAFEDVLDERGMVVRTPPEVAAMWRAASGPKWGRYIKIWAVRALAHCEPDETWWEVVEEALVHADGHVRTAALEALIERLPDHERTASELERALEGDLGRPRVLAISTLTDRGEPADRVLAELLAMRTLGPRERTHMSWVLTRPPPTWSARERVRVFEGVLADDVLWREAAWPARMLGADGAPLLPRLRELLETTEGDARRLEAAGDPTGQVDAETLADFLRESIAAIEQEAGQDEPAGDGGE